MTVSQAEQVREAPAPAVSRGRIVVGVDGSHWGRLALRWAAEHAWLAGAHLEVHAPPADAPDDGIDSTRRKYPSLPVRLCSGPDAAAGLVEASRGADLVVLGCRGGEHHGFGPGATVRPVVADADCDVLVVGGRASAVRGAYRQVTVLLGGQADQWALRSGARLAALHQAHLHLVLPVAMTEVRVPDGMVANRLAMLDRAENLVRRTLPGTRVTTHLARMSPHEAATTYPDTDVLVLGVRDELDAVASAALQQAACPVLIARAR